jgi:TPR repeat protein
MRTHSSSFPAELGRELRAALAGDGAAAAAIGDRYRDGRGVAGDPAKAFRWYGRGALAGDARARVWLAVCFHEGLGCERNPLQALKWYRLALAQGRGDAAYGLGLCHLHGAGVVRDLPRAEEYFQRAIELGCVAGHAGLAELRLGVGGRRREAARAARLLLAAAKGGDRCALRRLRGLRRELETRARAGWEDAARVLATMWASGLGVDCVDGHLADAWLLRAERAASRPGPPMCEDVQPASPPLPGGDSRTAGAPHS